MDKSKVAHFFMAHGVHIFAPHAACSFVCFYYDNCQIILRWSCCVHCFISVNFLLCLL